MQGPSGEQLKLSVTNLGTSSNPNLYLTEWNSTKIWDFTYNPWTGAVDNSPTIYNDSTTSGAALTTAQSQYASVTEPVFRSSRWKQPQCTCNLQLLGLRKRRQQNKLTLQLRLELLTIMAKQRHSSTYNCRSMEREHGYSR